MKSYVWWLRGKRSTVFFQRGITSGSDASPFKATKFEDTIATMAGTTAALS